MFNLIQSWPYAKQYRRSMDHQKKEIEQKGTPFLIAKDIYIYIYMESQKDFWKDNTDEDFDNDD